MHNYSLRQFGRTLLTIMGIILLVIFGSRAASQATSIAAVGGEPKRSLYPVSLTVPQLVALTASDTVHSAATAHAPTIETTPAAVQESTSSMASVDAKDKVARVADRVKSATAELAQQAETDISNVQSNSSNQDTLKPQHDLLETDVK